MNVSTIISLFLSPVLLALMMLYLNFKFSIKTWKYIRQAIIWGLISVVLVVAANYIIRIWGLENLKNMRRTAFYVFVVIAFGSEFAKLLVLRFRLFGLKSFDSPLAGIVYAVFVGLGFSTSAAVLYALGILGTEKMKYMEMFLWTYPFANIVFGIVLGFFTGMAKVRDNRLIDTFSGLGTAMFFHALYYFCFLTNDHRLLIFTWVGFFLIGLTLLIKGASVPPNTGK